MIGPGFGTSVGVIDAVRIIAVMLVVLVAGILIGTVL